MSNTEPKRPYYDPSKAQRATSAVVAVPTLIVAAPKKAIEWCVSLVELRGKKKQ